MARKSNYKILLGSLLLLSTLPGENALTLNTHHRSPVVSRTVVSGGKQFVVASSHNTPLRSVPDDNAANNIVQNIDRILETGKKSSRLPWLIFLATVLHARFLGGSSVPQTSDAVALSTVSATLLRRRQGIKFLSTQQLVAYGVIGWQLATNFGNMLAWTKVAGSAFITWYMGCLSAFPLYTKAATTGLIGLAGDTTAQVLEERIRSRREGTPFEFRRRYDRRRGVANVADSLLVTGPLLHFSYNFLETLIPVSGASSGMAASIAAITQVLIDDFILDAFFVGIMFFTTGIGEGYKLRDIVKQVRKDYRGAVRTSWATSVLLMPLEFVLFRFFPLSVRVLGMNFIDIIWEGMVSFLVHKRRRGEDNLEERVQDMQDMLSVDRTVPAL